MDCENVPVEEKFPVPVVFCCEGKLKLGAVDCGADPNNDVAGAVDVLEVVKLNPEFVD